MTQQSGFAHNNTRYPCVADKDRWYVVFSTHEEWYSPFVKLSISLYQRETAVFTHCFLVHAYIDRGVLEWYEVEYDKGPTICYVNFFDKLRYSEGILEMKCESRDEDPVTVALSALDVTQYIRECKVPVFLNAQLAGTISTPLTLCTLARHVVPFMQPIAWTCSGYVARILELLTPLTAFMNPPTPDELYDLTIAATERVR